MSLLVVLWPSPQALGAATTGVTTPYFSNANSPLVIASPGYQLENFESGALSLPAVTLTTLHGSSVDPHTSVDGDDGVLDGNGFNGSRSPSLHKPTRPARPSPSTMCCSAATQKARA
jgi:hypothetical protein